MSESGLTGRVAVVTGAGTGLGTAIARALAEAGADLLLHYRSSAASLDRVAADCRAIGRRVETAQADFAADPGLAAGVVDAAVGAAGADRHPRQQRRRHDEDGAVRVAQPGVLRGDARGQRDGAVPGHPGGRPTHGGGRARWPDRQHRLGPRAHSAPGAAAYETSKGGILALTAASAVALGQHGITVNCVAPGVIVVERYEDLGWDEAWYISRTPVGRNGARRTSPPRSGSWRATRPGSSPARRSTSTAG